MTDLIEHFAAARPGRGEKLCLCCKGDGGHGPGLNVECGPCDGDGVLHTEQEQWYCKGNEPARPARRRHWRQGAKSGWYHGTSADLKPGDRVVPGVQAGVRSHGPAEDAEHVWVSNDAWRAGKYGHRLYEVAPDDEPRHTRGPADEHQTTGATVMRELTPQESWALSPSYQAGIPKQADVDDYGGGHRPLEDGAPLHDPEDHLPGVYEHPEHYEFGDPAEYGRAEHRHALHKARGNPDARVNIYRAAPAVNPGKPNAHLRGEFNEGDWVTLDRQYAQFHADAHNEPTRAGRLPADHPERLHVWRATVPASHVRSGGSDLHEWGYWGPHKNAIHFPSCSHRPLPKGEWEREARFITEDEARESARQGPQYYHGTRAELRPGDMIEPGYQRANYSGHQQQRLEHAYFTTDPQEARAYAKNAQGDGIQRVYQVDPVGTAEPDKPRGHPDYRSADQLRVRHEVWHDTSWGDEPNERAGLHGLASLDPLLAAFYHASPHPFEPGDTVDPGHEPLFRFPGNPVRDASVYFTTSLPNAKAWAREAPGGGHVYEVEEPSDYAPDSNPTGPGEYQTQESLRVVRRVNKRPLHHREGELGTSQGSDPAIPLIALDPLLAAMAPAGSMQVHASDHGTLKNTRQNVAASLYSPHQGHIVFTAEALDVPVYNHRPEFLRAPEHLSDEEKMAHSDRQFEADRKWKRGIKRGLSLGHLTPEHAKSLGYYPNGHEINYHGEPGWAPLPHEMYHVTTDEPGVRAHGLKTREELNQIRGGHGLGGGEEDTISVTTNRHLAHHILRALHEFHDVANGRKTAQHLWDEAKAGVGAPRPFHEDIAHYWDPKWKDGDELPDGLRRNLEGAHRWSTGGTSQEMMDKHHPGSRPARDSAGWNAPAGRMHAWWERDMTEDEKRDHAADFYKTFAAYREHAGGHPDPMFFATDVKAFAAKDPRHFAMLHVRPRPGGHGYPLSGMNEWRTGTGDALEVHHAEHLGDMPHLGAEDGSKWEQGLCGTYAVALMRMRPGLKLGSAGELSDEGYWEQHFYAHDDKHAYDSRGRHPLPYLGAHNQFNHAELNADPDDYGLPDDEAGPEGSEHNIAEAQEHARRHNVLGQHTASSREEKGDRWHEYRNRHLPDTLHRGVHVQLDPDVHEYVHDESVPRADRARVLLDNAHRFGMSGLGQHWTPHINVAHRAIGNEADAWHGEHDEDDEDWGDEDSKGTDVIFHARAPGKRNEIRDPAERERQGVGWNYSRDEDETFLREGTPLRIQGISWKEHEPQYPNEPYEHHDFDRPERHTAGRNGQLPELSYRHLSGAEVSQVHYIPEGHFHYLEARPPGEPEEIGHITWSDHGHPEHPGQIHNVWVDQRHGRRGIATELFRRANEITPGLRHSDDLSGDARKWIRGMGDDPDKYQNLHEAAGAYDEVNWDEIHPDIESIHRGIGVSLPPELHKFVHDRRRSKETRAHALLSHLGGEWEEPRGLGPHWTMEHRVAEDFADRSARHQAEGKHPGTAVVFHASAPDRGEINDRAGDAMDVYHPYGHGEREVPLHHGASIELTGVSWAPHHDEIYDPRAYSERDGQYEHHTFSEPQYHQASLDPLVAAFDSDETDDTEYDTCWHCQREHNPMEHADEAAFDPDWEHELPKITSIHRTVALTLPEHEHKLVHDPSTPPHEAAATLLHHLTKPELSHSHWSTQEGREYGQRTFGGGGHDQTSVTLHARPPEPHHVWRDDPYGLIESQVTPLEAPEHEVPMAYNPVHLTGISWRHAPTGHWGDDHRYHADPEDSWKHHEFPGGHQIMAAVEHDHYPDKDLHWFEDFDENGESRGHAKVLEFPSKAWVSHLKVNPHHRRQGVGGAILSAITDHFDRQGKPTHLLPSPLDDEHGAMDEDELRDWYGRHGFSDTFNEEMHHHTAALERPFLNPYHGNPEFGGNPEFSHTWFHGTRGEPSFGERQNHFGDAQDYAKPPEERLKGHGWSQPNQHMGIHFSPLHEVGHKFAPSVSGQPTAIVHAQLNFSNPVHFPTERHLNYAVAHWASQHYPHWHSEKVNDQLAWNYSDREGTHRDFSQVPDDPRASDKAQDVLQWHQHLPEIIRGFHQHLHDNGHHGITYGNMVEGPYSTDATRGGQAGMKYIEKTQHFPRTSPRHISAIAQPEDISTTRVEHIAPWREEPEPHQQTWEQASALDEPDEMRDRVLGYHAEHGGAYPHSTHHTALGPQQLKLPGMPNRTPSWKPQPNPEASSAHHLHRGLYLGMGDARDVEELHRNPRQHLDKHRMGIHWTDDLTSAWRFAHGRDAEGWAEEPDEDQLGKHSMGLILHGEVHPRHVLQEGTQELEDYRDMHAILHEDHPEQEVTVRDDAPVHVTGITATSMDPDGNERETYHEYGRRHQAAWTPSSGIFAPTTGFDSVLFDDNGHLRVEARREILQKLQQALHASGYVSDGGIPPWLRVYLAGGSVSEWAGGRPNQGASDLDVLIGLDYDRLRHELAVHLPPGMEVPGRNSINLVVGGTVNLSDADLDGALNQSLRQHFNDELWQPRFGGTWSLTGYVNAHAWDITSLRPYAAYDLTNDQWAVRPPHSPEHAPDLGYDPGPQARAIASEIRAILRLPEPFRSQEGRNLWDRIHADRSMAFSPEGGGYTAPGNTVEKWLAYHPHKPLDKLRQLVFTSGLEYDHGVTPTGKYDPSQPVYLRFGDWSPMERSRNHITGYREEGVSAYELDEHGEPRDPDPHWLRGRHEHDEHCDPDCDIPEYSEESGNDTGEDMRMRIDRAEHDRNRGYDSRHNTGHLVQGEHVGFGGDDEPLLRKVHRVGDWIDHRHHFIPTAEPHRLAGIYGEHPNSDHAPNMPHHGALRHPGPEEFAHELAPGSEGSFRIHNGYLLHHIGQQHINAYKIGRELVAPDQPNYSEGHAKPQAVGYLSWFRPRQEGEPGEIYKTMVKEKHRRKGIASAMLDFAREVSPYQVNHSHALTEDGKAFAQAKASLDPLIAAFEYDLQPGEYFHGTTRKLEPGAQVDWRQADPSDGGRIRDNFMTTSPQVAGDFADTQGKGPGYVHVVRPTGPTAPDNDEEQSMRSHEPLDILQTFEHDPAADRQYARQRQFDHLDRASKEFILRQQREGAKGDWPAARSTSLYHGTSAELNPGDMIEPGHPTNWDDDRHDFGFKRDQHVFATHNIYQAWDFAEHSRHKQGGQPHVYEVEPTGRMHVDPEAYRYGNPTDHPSYQSRQPLRVVKRWDHLISPGYKQESYDKVHAEHIADLMDAIGGEHTAAYYHGSPAELQPGDHIELGHPRSHNPYGEPAEPREHVYLSNGRLDYIAEHYGPGVGNSLYEVEPTGPVTHDPEYSSRQMLRSKHPLKVVRKVSVNWESSTYGPEYFGPLGGKSMEGRTGDRSHLTRKEWGMMPIGAVRDLHGARGEQPGSGPTRPFDEFRGSWEDFRNEVRSKGIRPIFITVDHGEEPKISEGNHRRDMAVEEGHTHIPVEVSYFGNAQHQGTVLERHMRHQAAREKPVKTKAQVNYRKATTDHRCGNCVMIRMNPPDFESFGCTLVKGLIEEADTCDEWSPAKSKTASTVCPDCGQGPEEHKSFDTLYHATSPRNRKSIGQTGLRTEFEQGEGYTEPGVYMSPHPPAHPDEDVWRVDARGLKVHPDEPMMMHEFRDVGGAYFSRDDIPPHRLTMHQEGRGNKWIGHHEGLLAAMDPLEMAGHGLNSMSPADRQFFQDAIDHVRQGKPASEPINAEDASHMARGFRMRDRLKAAGFDTSPSEQQKYPRGVSISLPEGHAATLSPNNPQGWHVRTHHRSDYFAEHIRHDLPDSDEEFPQALHRYYASPQIQDAMRKQRWSIGNTREARYDHRMTASGYELSPRSGMISLDLPEEISGALYHPGGVADHHITLVYLGKDVDDAKFEEACRRAGELAAAHVPVSLLLRGLDSFDPSEASDWRRPYYVPAILSSRGYDLRRKLQDLSASEFKDWVPHVTLAYCGDDEEIPKPLGPMRMFINGITVHRGDEKRYFPFRANALTTA